MSQHTPVFDPCCRKGNHDRGRNQEYGSGMTEQNAPARTENIRSTIPRSPQLRCHVAPTAPVACSKSTLLPSSRGASDPPGPSELVCSSEVFSRPLMMWWKKGTYRTLTDPCSDPLTEGWPFTRYVEPREMLCTEHPHTRRYHRITELDCQRESMRTRRWRTRSIPPRALDTGL